MWGYISIDLSPDPSFLPQFSAGGGLFRTLKGFEIGTSVRYMSFRRSEVILLIPSFILYLPRGFFYTASLYLNVDGGTYTLANRLSYKRDRWYAFLYVSAGTSSERLEATEDVLKYRTSSFGFGAEYRINKKFSFGTSFIKEYRAGLYTRRGFDIYGRYWW